MKFLHLSDLHLGKQMNDVSLLADQEAVLLGQVVPIARRENVDAVLIAGDVYQRATPQAEAVALFDRFVSELAAMGKRVFIISGNHDSAQRISYFSALVRSAGVYVTEAFEGRMQSVTLSDEYGELTVWMLPFLLNFIIGGVIGGFVLVWRLLVSTWYIPLTIYRLFITRGTSYIPE